MEIKTTVDPVRLSKKAWVWQLLGDALLDFADRCGIREVGVCLTRQAALIRWNPGEYMELLAGGPTSLAERERSSSILYVRQIDQVVKRGALTALPSY